MEVSTMMIILGYEEKESFTFPNNYEINIDYGIITDRLTPGKDKYIPGRQRSNGQFRRLILFHNDKIVSEYVEKNPNRLASNQREKIEAEGKIIGDEYERTFSFPNGFSAKIEYWVSPTERDYGCGMYTSKYRKMILFDDNKNIVSEIFEDNSDYFDPTGGVSDEEMYADGYTCY